MTLHFASRDGVLCGFTSEETVSATSKTAHVSCEACLQLLGHPVPAPAPAPPEEARWGWARSREDDDPEEEDGES